MKLEELDFFEFFKDEYGTWYDGFGIGGAGIITPTQMINVVNIDGAPKDGVLPGWGGGSHMATYAEMVRQIYKIEYNNLNPFKLPAMLRTLEFRLIKIRYVNEQGLKYVVVKVPAKINKFQYDSLCKLNTMIQAVNTLSKNKIEVFVNNSGYLPNFIEGKKIEVENPYYDKELNNLPIALEYYEKHITIISPNVFPKEYKIELSKGKKR